MSLEHSFIEQHLIVFLRKLAKVVAKKFNLKFKKLDLFELDDPERLGCWGICYEDGEIRLNLRRKRNMRLDGFDSILDTLVHELAHLKRLKHNDALNRRVASGLKRGLGGNTKGEDMSKFLTVVLKLADNAVSKLVFDQADRINGATMSAASWSHVMDERDRYRAALEKLARLGNEPHYGNSDGNRIAQEALGVEVGVDA